MPRKKEVSLETLKKKIVPIIDTRSTDNNGILVKRDRKITMVDIFGTEQKAAVAYFTSELLAKGFNNQQIIETIEKKYGLKWTMRQVNIVKDLLKRVWRSEIAYTMNDQIAKELSAIDVQTKELWAAWEFSKKGIQKEKKRSENSKSKAPEMQYDLTEIIIESDTSAGDPRYMQQIASLGVERRKLLGLYAPEKKNDTSQGNTAIQLNIVGDGAGQEAADVMKAILGSGTGNTLEKRALIEEAEIVESNELKEHADENNIDLDAFWNEFLDD